MPLGNRLRLDLAFRGGAGLYRAMTLFVISLLFSIPVASLCLRPSFVDIDLYRYRYTERPCLEIQRLLGTGVAERTVSGLRLSGAFLVPYPEIAHGQAVGYGRLKDYSQDCLAVSSVLSVQCSLDVLHSCPSHVHLHIHDQT